MSTTTKAPEKAARGKAEPVARPEPTPVELPTEGIDPTAARGVRECLNEEAVGRYVETDAEWSGAVPVDVYSGGGMSYLADGRHRLEARTRGGHRTILARVHECDSADAALAAAYRHAAGANRLHGLPRSAADKRAAVKACLTRPEYERSSDSEVAGVCHVGHILVRLVREELSHAGAIPVGSAAHAATRGYKQDAELRQGYRSDGMGGLQKIEPPPAAGPAPGPVMRPEDTSPRPAPRKAGEVRDARGRLVPDIYRDHFEQGREFATDVRDVLGEVFDALQVASGEEWGRPLAAVLNPCEIDLKNLKEAAANSVPYVCCPHTDAAGGHVYSGTCKVCQGRGWVTKNVYHQFAQALKDLCDERAGKPKAA